MTANYEMKKLSAWSKDSSRVKQLHIVNADGLSQVSESYDQSFLSNMMESTKNEVDMELMELMK